MYVGKYVYTYICICIYVYIHVYYLQTKIDDRQKDRFMNIPIYIYIHDLVQIHVDLSSQFLEFLPESNRRPRD